MDWIVWIKGSLSSALGWCEAHPGIANWLQAIGSIAAIALIYLFALFQFRRTRSHEEIDRIRKAQGLALILVAVLVAFKPKIEAAIAQQSKIEPPDEALRLLDQLYVLGVAGGLILQMIATLQAHDQAASPSDEAEDVRNSYASIGRQRLDLALRYCEDAIDALTKLTRVRTA
jgi:undecaprenyl pyrophosphate phosphatase UppP